MILHPAAQHIPMPWANGRGQTVEMLREEGAGGLILRLSVATVGADGPFSTFPGVDRVLTVITGPGFRLTGAVSAPCLPMVPVAFPGDVPVAAEGVTAPSEDFNVMVARGTRVAVWPVDHTVTAGGRVLVLMLAAGRVNGQAVGARDLVEARDEALVLDAPGLAVRVGDPPPRPWAGASASEGLG